MVPSKERKRYEREGLDARRRGERRARTRTLDLVLSLAELWLRDVLCVSEGAGELVLRGGPPRGAGRGRAGARGAARLREGIELVGETRLSLALNVVGGAGAGGARLPAGSSPDGLRRPGDACAVS